MPSNKNAFTRYKVLDELLSNRYHKYTIDDLVDNVNNRLAELSIEPVSRRCIEKDLDYLRGIFSPFCADIVATYEDIFNGIKTVRRKCYRYADPSFSIFKKALSTEEEYLLLQALSILGQFDGLPNLEELERLRIGLSDKNMRQVVLITKNPLEHTNLFGELFTAITQKQVVKLEYHLFDELKTKKEIFLHPYLLKEYNCRWYIFGLAERDRKPLCFGLERIDKATPVPSHKYFPYEGQFDEWFDDIVGITKFEDKPIKRIFFWVSDYSKDYVCTKPIHDSQIKYSGEKESELRKTYPQLKYGAFFSIDCRENYELIRELISYGDSLIVLFPTDIQDKIVARISAMSERYSTLRR